MHSHLESILSRIEFSELLPLFVAAKVTDSLLLNLTDEDLKNIGIEKFGIRKLLLAEFAEYPVQPTASEQTAEPVTAPVALAEPSAAKRDRPYVNSLGQPFVPIAGFKALFCVWQVRVGDFQSYCQECSIPYPECDFEQDSDHPAVNLTWHEAVAFCDWLTKREHQLGLIPRALVYRLPEDREWSAAAGLIHEPEKTPAERSGKREGYPWGPGFPPPSGAGNYHSSLGSDNFPATAPVGSFAANTFGIFDLGGNVWEWCLDDFDRGGDRKVLRGASCFNDDNEYLLSSYRDKNTPNNRRNNNGFRVVLGKAHQKDVWF